MTLTTILGHILGGGLLLGGAYYGDPDSRNQPDNPRDKLYLGIYRNQTGIFRIISTGVEGYLIQSLLGKPARCR